MKKIQLYMSIIFFACLYFGLNGPLLAKTMDEMEADLARQDRTTAILERIRPEGRVHVRTISAASTTATATTSTAETPAVKPVTPSSGLTPEKIYQTHCVACHMTGAAGAPKLDDKAAWAPRLAEEKKSPGYLLHSVKNGKTAMPPKGLCNDCSDDDLKATIEYMTKGVKN